MNNLEMYYDDYIRWINIINGVISENKNVGIKNIDISDFGEFYNNILKKLK